MPTDLLCLITHLEKGVCGILGRVYYYYYMMYIYILYLHHAHTESEFKIAPESAAIDLTATAFDITRTVNGRPRERTFTVNFCEATPESESPCE